MKKMTSSLLAIALLLAACGQSDQKKETEAVRYENSAKTYQHQGQYRAAIIEARNAIQLRPDEAAGYMVLARIYNDVGAYASTRALLETRVAALPVLSVELAEAYFEGKKYRSALDLLNQYLALSPDDNEKIRIYRVQARAAIALGDNSGFSVALKSLQSLDDTAAETDNLNALFKLSQGDREAAEAVLEKSLELHPQSLANLLLSGQVSLLSNQLDVAEKRLTEALALTRVGDVMTVERAAILSSLTQVLIQQGRTSEAYAYQRLLAEANSDSETSRQQFADALELYQQGKLPEAEALLNLLRETNPQHKEAGTLLGLIQYQQGDHEQASLLFDRYLDPETASSSLIQTAVVAKMRSNHLDEAIALLREATASQPDNAVIQASLGLALLDADATSEEGAKALERSIELNPVQQRLRIALAKRLVLLNDKVGAIAQLELAYRNQKEDLTVQQTYLQTLIDEGFGEKAEQEIAAFQSENPTSSRGYFLRGWFDLNQQRYSLARGAFEKNLVNPDDPDRAIALIGIAQSYEAESEWVKAADTWTKLLKETPAQIEGYSSWLNALQRAERSDSAIPFLIELEKNIQVWQASVVLAQLEYNQQQLQKAISHIDIALERSGQVDFVRRIAANLYNERGLLYRAEGNVSESRISFMKALEYNPDEINYLTNLIDVELHSGHRDQAAALLNQFKPADDEMAAFEYLRGVILSEQGNHVDALAAFKKSWSVQPTEGTAEAVFSTLQKSGQDREQQAWLAEWLSAFPDSARATLINAIQLQSTGKSEEAKALYKRVISLAPDSAIAFNNLAWLYHDKKDIAALEYARKAYELAPRSALIMDTYGWMLVEHGNIKEGVALLEQAASAAPDNEDIQKHLKQARQRLAK